MKMPGTAARERVWQVAHGNRRFTVCAKCGDDFEYARSYAYCNPCKAAYMREWRKTHRLEGEARRKDTCRAYSHVLLKRGKLQRQPCEVRGCKSVAQMHHEDYSNPRYVRWLCKEHHIEHHQQEQRFICLAA